MAEVKSSVAGPAAPSPRFLGKDDDDQNDDNFDDVSIRIAKQYEFLTDPDALTPDKDADDLNIALQIFQENLNKELEEASKTTMIGHDRWTLAKRFIQSVQRLSSLLDMADGAYGAKREALDRWLRYADALKESLPRWLDCMKPLITPRRRPTLPGAPERTTAEHSAENATERLRQWFVQPELSPQLHERVPISMIYGPPASGKTAVVASIAYDLGRALVEKLKKSDEWKDVPVDLQTIADDPGAHSVSYVVDCLPIRQRFTSNDQVVSEIQDTLACAELHAEIKRLMTRAFPFRDRNGRNENGRVLYRQLLQNIPTVALLILDNFDTLFLSDAQLRAWRERSPAAKDRAFQNVLPSYNTGQRSEVANRVSVVSLPPSSPPSAPVKTAEASVPSSSSSSAAPVLPRSSTVTLGGRSGGGGGAQRRARTGGVEPNPNDLGLRLVRDVLNPDTLLRLAPNVRVICNVREPWNLPDNTVDRALSLRDILTDHRIAMNLPDQSLRREYIEALIFNELLSNWWQRFQSRRLQDDPKQGETGELWELERNALQAFINVNDWTTLSTTYRDLRSKSGFENLTPAQTLRTLIQASQDAAAAEKALAPTPSEKGAAEIAPSPDQVMANAWRALVEGYRPLIDGIVNQTGIGWDGKCALAEAGLRDREIQLWLSAVQGDASAPGPTPFGFNLDELYTLMKQVFKEAKDRQLQSELNRMQRYVYGTTWTSNACKEVARMSRLGVLQKSQMKLPIYDRGRAGDGDGECRGALDDDLDGQVVQKVNQGQPSWYYESAIKTVQPRLRFGSHRFTSADVKAAIDSVIANGYVQPKPDYVKYAIYALYKVPELTGRNRPPRHASLIREQCRERRFGSDAPLVTAPVSSSFSSSSLPLLLTRPISAGGGGSVTTVPNGRLARIRAYQA